jgi:hypothetical protein
MQDPDFSEIVNLICKEDPRFDRKAYDFVRLGLDHTVKELRKRDAERAEKSRHVTGPELLETTAMLILAKLLTPANFTMWPTSLQTKVVLHNPVWMWLLLPNLLQEHQMDLFHWQLSTTQPAKV